MNDGTNPNTKKEFHLMATQGAASALRQFWYDLHARTHNVFTVLDEALNSEDFKQRSWAVEVLLKKLSPDKETLKHLKSLFEILDEEELATSDPELLALHSMNKQSASHLNGASRGVKLSDEELLQELAHLFVGEPSLEL
jgi:hypothetical protein